MLWPVVPSNPSLYFPSEQWAMGQCLLTRCLQWLYRTWVPWITRMNWALNPFCLPHLSSLKKLGKRLSEGSGPCPMAPSPQPELCSCLLEIPAQVVSRGEWPLYLPAGWSWVNYRFSSLGRGSQYYLAGLFEERDEIHGCQVFGTVLRSS